MNKDGKLNVEEFVLAMHLVDMAKSGQPLPLTLPTELVPPSQRYDDNVWKWFRKHGNILGITLAQH